MNKLVIKSMYGENFLGMGKFEQEFSNNMAIKGQNGKGKTSFYRLLLWVLFGKDVNGKKLNPRPHDEHGNDIHHIEIKAGFVCEIDGTVQEFTRVKKEQWNREKTEIAGNPEKYFVNGVEMKAKEFENHIKSLVDEEIFMNACNVGEFNRRSTAEKRKLLFNKLSKVDDDDVIKTSEEFKQRIPQILSLGKKVEDVLEQKKKELNVLKKKDGTFSARIHENESKIQEIDVAALTAARKDKTEELRKIQSEIASQSAGTEQSKYLNARIIEIQSEKADVQRNLNSGLVKQKSQLDKEISDCENKWNELQTEQGKRRSDMLRNVDSVNRDIESKKRKISELEEEIRPLRDKYVEKYEEKFDTSCTICHTCGREFSADKVNELVKQFEENKDVQLKKIKSRGDEINSEIKKLNAQISELESEKKKETEEFETWEKSIIEQKSDVENRRIELEKQLKELPDSIPFETDPEWLKLDAEEQELQKQLSELQDGNSIVDTLIEKQNEIIEEINSIDSRLKYQEYNENLENAIQSIREEQKQHEQLKADTMKEIDLYERYLKKKAEMVANEIDSCFTCIHWKLTDVLQNGNINDCCECILKDSGSDYANASHGERMRMDLDIVKAIQNIYGISLPVFVDDAESIDEDKIPQFEQVIKLFHTEDKELIFEL